MSVNFRLEVTKIISQRKAFYRERITESSCGRKETVDIDILVTSRNDDRKIMQTIRTTSRPPSKIRKWNLIVLTLVYHIVLSHNMALFLIRHLECSGNAQIPLMRSICSF